MRRLRPELLVLTILTFAACAEDPTGVPAPLVLPLTDQIVFESNALDTLGDVFVMKIDGTDRRRLTGSDTHDFCPALSPDGVWIAFLQLALIPGGSIYSSAPSMVLMKADGTEKRILNKYQSAFYSDCPVWSKDSRLVAFASPVEPRVRSANEPIVRTYDTAGNLVAQFTAVQLTAFSFSPDNGRFLYSTHGFSIGPPIDFHLETVSLNGSDRRRVTPGFNGDWAPDGSGIGFDTCGGSCAPEMVTSCPAICITSPEGVNQQVLTTSGRHPVFSPNGDRVAYSCGTDLCIGPTAGGPITTIPAAAESIVLVWSPDGESIGFICLVGVETDICIADLKTGMMTNLTNTPTNETNLSFSPRSSH